MRIEWPTLALIVLCYAAWGVAVFLLPNMGLALSVLALVPIIALQSSLQHEVLHGHPFGNRKWGEPLVLASLNLAIPYLRFRDTHLAHHRDESLTDPYDDPESNYLAPDVWARLPGIARMFLAANNTLLGRMLLGPILAQAVFMVGDWRLIRGGDRGVARAWAIHIGLSGVVIWIVASAMPVWAYAIACYGGLAILKIRTFLEHQAHTRARGRTVIIEDRGPLAFLFLNNNLHVVHHMHPKVPWYRLPGVYFTNPDKYLRRNEGYRYASYAQVFRRHFLRAKDPVAHPLIEQK